MHARTCLRREDGPPLEWDFDELPQAALDAGVGGKHGRSEPLGAAGGPPKVCTYARGDSCGHASIQLGCDAIHLGSFVGLKKTQLESFVALRVPLLESLCWSPSGEVPVLEPLCWSPCAGVPVLESLCWSPCAGVLVGRL